MLRLFALVVMLFYCFSLFLVPYDWRKSCVDKKLILFYSSCFCLMGLLNICIQISHSYLFMLAHQVVWGTFFLSVSWFELKERLPIPKGVLKSEESAICDSVGDGLWSKIIVLFDDNEKWRDPNLSLSSLSDMLESNRTYIGEAFKRNVNMTFVEYITKRRIDYVTTLLKADSNVDIQELFNYVGYRQRSTAWRNFQKITGQTPTEFIESLK